MPFVHEHTVSQLTKYAIFFFAHLVCPIITFSQTEIPGPGAYHNPTTLEKSDQSVSRKGFGNMVSRVCISSNVFSQSKAH